MTTVQMLDADCDRCGNHVDEVRPYTLTATITFRGKVVEKPWMCTKCFVIEKKKWWAVLIGSKPYWW